mmetsp:Transcript_4961/g.14202  ORF Transcript_4961/g.14202 Transcript_4961/m.14202 type:complete len:217 (-) Transcript_4961:524-1174(-)
MVVERTAHPPPYTVASMSSWPMGPIPPAVPPVLPPPRPGPDIPGAAVPPLGSAWNGGRTGVPDRSYVSIRESRRTTTRTHRSVNPRVSTSLAEYIRRWLIAKEGGGNSTDARGRPDAVRMRSCVVDRAAVESLFAPLAPPFALLFVPPPPAAPLPPSDVALNPGRDVPATGSVMAAMGPPLGHPATLVAVAVWSSLRMSESSSRFEEERFDMADRY